jgi:hypothetical protein
VGIDSDRRARIVHELLESLDGDGGDERAREVEAVRAALVEGGQSGTVEGSSLAALQWGGRKLL